MMLYEHQIEGARWLAARKRGYLGDRPGLGKTRTAIAALDENENTLIVCPAIVRTHWRRELELMNVDNAVVKSYDEITRGGNELMKHLLTEGKVRTLLIDEAHYAKHASAQRTKVLLGVSGYARRMSHVYALSGTPVPKNPSELYTILASMFPEVLVRHGIRSFRGYVDRFCATRMMFVRGKSVEKFMPEVRNEAQFKEILAEIMLARTLDDVGLDVPALDWQITRLDGQTTVGDPVFADGLTGGRIAAAASAGTLADIADDPELSRMRRRLGELKVEPVVRMLQEQLADSDEKVVVFAHHRSVLRGIADGLHDQGLQYIDGDTSQKFRDIAIDRFQHDPEIRVFVGQNIACQTGITLTAARRVVLVEPDWNAVVNDQLGHRVARIGQTAERCIGQMIALAGTLDEAIIGTNHKEVRMAASIGLGG